MVVLHHAEFGKAGFLHYEGIPSCLFFSFLKQRTIIYIFLNIATADVIRGVT